MTKPTRAPLIVLGIFGLPFAGMGLVFAWKCWNQFLQYGRTTDVSAIAFGLLFVLIGCGLIALGFKASQLTYKQAALEQANPQSPWLWREDWAQSRAQNKSGGRYIFATIIAIAWNAITVPLIVSQLPKMVRNSDPRMFLFAAFGICGVLLVAYAAYSTLRRERFGSSYFQFDTLPFVPGGHVRGTINLKLATHADHGFDVRLRCERQVIEGSGRDRTTITTVLWEAQQNVPQVAPGPMGVQIPVDFAIPADAYTTDGQRYGDKMLWVLHAKADVPGVDFSEDFEVPVFRTASATATQPQTVEFGSEEQPASEVIVPPANPKVVISSDWNGTEFFFPANRNPRITFILFVVLLIWSASIFALFKTSRPAPLPFRIIFPIGDALIMFAFLQAAFGSVRVHISREEVECRSRILGFVRTRKFVTSEVESILAGVSSQTNGSTSMYCIRLHTKSEQTVTLAGGIEELSEVKWVASEMEKAAGLKQDAHLEPNPYLAPPFASGPQVPGSQFPQPGARSNNAKIALLVFAVQLCVMGGVFYHFFTRVTVRRPVRANNANAVAIQSPAPKPLYVALTDDEAHRVLMLDSQQQAEELFRRAVSHDPLALEMLEKHSDQWVGRIQQTDEIKQLEDRARYSDDLRVRLADCDMELALDGWKKNEESVEMLIERIKTDQQYKFAGLYFLGMLGGRGIETQRVNDTLFDYAQHDIDAATRQWATEGLRFLKTDQALAEMFEIFTTDPSYQVRDRAGCNVSDCGVFERKQRMEYVPKLMTLAQDPATDAQMRNWSFLALQEITDLHLPSEAKQWQLWYEKNGAQKEAEFERLEWWQVRGDH